MWILSADLRSLRISLPQGQHLIPWYYSDAEVDQTASLLRGAIDGIHREIHLDEVTLPAAARRRVRAADALVVVRIERASLPIDDVLTQIRALGPGWALLRFPEPQEVGYGWLEQHLKVPLLQAVRAEIAQPDHPLAPFNIRHLPALEAAALTTDPHELLLLLERTVAQRMAHAEVGLEEEDYLRSLHVVAGRRLAERLQELSGKPLQQALEMILSQGKEPLDREDLRAGAGALQRVGLARLVGADISLGPLVRRVEDLRMLGALEEKLPKEAWTDATRALVQSIRSQQNLPALSLPMDLIGEQSSSWVVPLPIDLLRPAVALAFPGEALASDALQTLQELSELPLYVWEVPAPIQDRTTAALRWLDIEASSGDQQRRNLARVLEALLRLFSARGDGALDAQEAALRLLGEALERVGDAWGAPIEAVAQFHHAGFLANRPRSGSDYERAASLVSECINFWQQDPHEEASVYLSASYLMLGHIAREQRDQDRARECYAKAMRPGQPPANLLAEVWLALAYEANASHRPDEAERLARESLAFYAQTHDRARIAACLRVIASSNADKGKVDRSIELLREALGAATQAGILSHDRGLAVHAAHSSLVVGLAYLSSFQMDEAAAAAHESAIAYERLGMRKYTHDVRTMLERIEHLRMNPGLIKSVAAIYLR